MLTLSCAAHGEWGVGGFLWCSVCRSLDMGIRVSCASSLGLL